MLASLFLALSISACTSSQPGEATPSNSPHFESVTATQAKSIWEAYFGICYELSSGARSAVSDVEPYVTEAEYKAVSSQIEELRQKKILLKGRVTSRGFRLLNSGSDETLAAQVCVDNGNSKFVNRDGNDVTPEGRQQLFTLRLEFLREKGKLRLDKDTLWTEKSAC